MYEWVSLSLLLLYFLLLFTVSLILYHLHFQENAKEHYLFIFILIFLFIYLFTTIVANQKFRRTMVYAKYILEGLGRFTMIFRAQKHLIWMHEAGFLSVGLVHWDTRKLHAVQDWKSAKTTRLATGPFTKLWSLRTRSFPSQMLARLAGLSFSLGNPNSSLDRVAKICKLL